MIIPLHTENKDPKFVRLDNLMLYKKYIPVMNGDELQRYEWFMLSSDEISCFTPDELLSLDERHQKRERNIQKLFSEAMSQSITNGGTRTIPTTDERKY